MKNKFSLILGDKNLSSWSLRPWLILKHVGADFDEHIIKLRTTTTKSEILKYSPAGKVPILIHDNNVIWESLAIAEYLNELFPKSNLWPQDQIARAFARSISNEMHAGFMTLREMMPFCLNEAKETPSFVGLDTDINRIINIWQDCRLKYSKPGEYLFGDFTIADAMFAPVVLRFKTYNYLPVNHHARDYYNTILNDPLIQEWAADLDCKVQYEK